MTIRCHGQDSISAHDAQSPIAMSEFQSNSPFPPSNFNPRPPLVQYRFHSVFPTMSPQESRTLWCLVEGDPIPYYVRDIPIGANVTQLKELLPDKIDCLDKINPRHLELRKVVSLKFQGRAPSDFLFQLNVIVPIGPDHSLGQRLADLGDIIKRSTKLSSEEEVGELFPEPHSRKHLHIVVQCEIPSPSSPSGE